MNLPNKYDSYARRHKNDSYARRFQNDIRKRYRNEILIAFVRPGLPLTRFLPQKFFNFHDQVLRTYRFINK